MAAAKQLPVVLTGTVYLDWNAFDYGKPLPDKKYWKAGDLVVWSWSGDSKNPSSKSTGGLFNVSVIVGVRSLRRARLKVKRTRVHRNLPFSSDCDRHEQLKKLVAELEQLKGRSIEKARFGYEVTLGQPAVVSAAASPARTAPAGESPRAEPPRVVPRGRVKPGIRSEVPLAVELNAGKRQAASAPPVMAVVVAIVAPAAAATKKRRRRKTPDPRQGNLF